MKVTGKVAGLSYRNICLVTVPDGIDVPLGAKVRIKWAKRDENENIHSCEQSARQSLRQEQENPNVHECEVSVRQGKLISRVVAYPSGKGGQWCVTEFSGDGNRNGAATVSGIRFCPYCGVRLPE